MNSGDSFVRSEEPCEPVRPVRTSSICLWRYISSHSIRSIFVLYYIHFLRMEIDGRTPLNAAFELEGVSVELPVEILASPVPCQQEMGATDRISAAPLARRLPKRRVLTQKARRASNMRCFEKCNRPLSYSRQGHLKGFGCGTGLEALERAGYEVRAVRDATFIAVCSQGRKVGCYDLVSQSDCPSRILFLIQW